MGCAGRGRGVLVRLRRLHLDLYAIRYRRIPVVGPLFLTVGTVVLCAAILAGIAPGVVEAGAFSVLAVACAAPVGAAPPTDIGPGRETFSTGGASSARPRRSRRWHFS